MQNRLGRLGVGVLLIGVLIWWAIDGADHPSRQGLPVTAPPSSSTPCPFTIFTITKRVEAAGPQNEPGVWLYRGELRTCTRIAGCEVWIPGPDDTPLSIPATATDLPEEWFDPKCGK